MTGNVRWIPLESNPEAMTKFLESVGVSKKWKINDVYGLDSEMLALLPRPVLALLMLFPLNEKICGHLTKQEAETKDQDVSSNVYFLKQTVGNACGTIALIHSVANNLDSIELSDGHLKKFLEATQGLTPEERAAKLESDEGLSSAHEDSALAGETEAPSRDEKVDLHFVAFVEKDGLLYELDGRKSRPVPHGPTNRDSFVEDAAKVCRALMAVDPEENHFTLLALTGASSE